MRAKAFMSLIALIGVVSSASAATLYSDFASSSPYFRQIAAMGSPAMNGLRGNLRRLPLLTSDRLSLPSATPAGRTLILPSICAAGAQIQVA
jgi:predicted membrane-bound spermidine synthase